MIRVHNDAAADLRRIRDQDLATFGRLMALIEQLKCDPGLQANLLTHDFGGDGDAPISVKRWGSVTAIEKVPTWRLRAWDLEKDGLHFRLLYVYSTKLKQYLILAVAKRSEINYDDPANPIRIRVVNRVIAERLL